MSTTLPCLSAAVIAFLACSAPAQVPCGNLTVTISPNPAPHGAPVTVTVTNNTLATESLATSCVITGIYPILGNAPVYFQPCLPVLTPVPPGGQVSETWDQKGFCGQQVDPATYVVVVAVVPASASCAVPFTIDPCQAGGIASFGSGCGTGLFGCLGTSTLTLGECPLVASPVTFRLSNGPANAPSALALGASNTSWMGVPLPIPIGLGCSILVSLDVFLPPTFTDSLGLALFSASIPADPALVGQTVYAQGGAIAPPGAVRTTNGLSVTIG
ncbi:MAG: hypothetical protein L0323_10105 [Planctomycetes bacterium]|nr:hypothetical protein [Planctomycetota bacterium]